MTRVLFLPGISGEGSFWDPVAQRLPGHWQAETLDWPGLGRVPASPTVTCFDDLTGLVLDRLEAPTVLVGQSMGGVVALRAALAAGERVTHLVLAVTSGGLPMADLGATDWRAGFNAAWPDAPAWALEPVPDLTAQLSRITCPVLLVWATRDPISPLAAGERLLAALPQARLVSYDSDDHWVAAVHAEDVATEIADFISAGPPQAQARR